MTSAVRLAAGSVRNENLHGTHIAIVTAFVGILYIAGRVGHVIVPSATVGYYRRPTSSPERIRFSSLLLFVMVAVPPIVTARQARADKGDITI